MKIARSPFESLRTNEIPIACSELVEGRLPLSPPFEKGDLGGFRSTKFSNFVKHK